ncbi:hypothetical protein ACHAQA_004734 [Verticillium albo-atrum]
MDHGDAMTMASTVATATGMDMAAATDAAATSGHDDMADMMGGCKISMLWNWNTVDSCFIAESWHITSTGMFAGSCIGVILLVLALEALRRAGKEYDRHLIRSHAASSLAAASAVPAQASNDSASGGKNSGDPVAHTAPLGAGGVAIVAPFRPSILQQAVRALLHMLQFAVAYFIMLLAMYYNGYIIICIFIGAYLGSFIFHWEKIGGSTGPTSAGESSTVCCG